MWPLPKYSPHVAQDLHRQMQLIVTQKHRTRQSLHGILADTATNGRQTACRPKTQQAKDYAFPTWTARAGAASQHGWLGTKLGRRLFMIGNSFLLWDGLQQHNLACIWGACMQAHSSKCLQAGGQIRNSPGNLPVYHRSLAPACPI